MFNGYIVRFHNHETNGIETDRYETEADLAAAGFAGIPSAQQLTDDLYGIFGDRVIRITDNAGAVLLER